MTARATRWRQRSRHWRRSFKHSLKARLVALFVLLALGMTAVFLFGMQRVLQGGWQQLARPLVADYVDRVVAELGSPPDLARARALVARLPIWVRIEGPTVQYDSHPERRRYRRFDGEDGDSALGLTRSSADGHRVSFGLAVPDPGLHPRGVGWATLAVLLAMTLLAYLTVRRWLAPLQDIGRGVEAFGQGRFEPRITVRRQDELGALAERINTMAGSLQQMLDAKRGLLLAISHELRSPLTRARLNAELVAEGPERSALLHDLAEMRDLITSLLESERLAAGHEALQREAVDLGALVHEVLQSQFTGRAVQLRLDAAVPRVQADPTRLRLLLRNLLDNAWRHGGDTTAPEVYLSREPDARLALGVRDHGPGVGEEQLARLSEAFYRTDSARTRSSGGVGLGLTLCRLVAQAHGGELRIRRAAPGLDVAMVWLPRQVD